MSRIMEFVEGPVSFVDTRNNKREGKGPILKPLADRWTDGVPFGRPYGSPFAVEVRHSGGAPYYQQDSERPHAGASRRLIAMFCPITSVSTLLRDACVMRGGLLPRRRVVGPLALRQTSAAPFSR